MQIMMENLTSTSLLLLLQPDISIKSFPKNKYQNLKINLRHLMSIKMVSYQKMN
jgi:hypothetical protein